MDDLAKFIYHLEEALLIYCRNQEITVETVMKRMTPYPRETTDNEVTATIAAIVATLDEETTRLSNILEKRNETKLWELGETPR